MKKCSPDCQAACDFCVFFDYNGEDLVDENGKIYPGALYVGNGHCALHDRHTDPGWECGDFCCMNVFRDELNAQDASSERSG